MLCFPGMRKLTSQGRRFRTVKRSQALAGVSNIHRTIRVSLVKAEGKVFEEFLPTTLRVLASSPLIIRREI